MAEQATPKPEQVAPASEQPAQPSEQPADAPSMYPKTTEYKSEPATTVSESSASKPVSQDSEALPTEYELLIEVVATVKEKCHPSASKAELTPLLPTPVTDVLRVIQGPLGSSLQPTGDEKEEALYHSFISICDINLPLLSTQPVRRVGSDLSRKFALLVRDRVFHIHLHPETEPDLVDGFQRLLQWFCKWEDDAAPDVSAGESVVGSTWSHEKVARAGDRGVHFVESVGNKINSSIQKRITPRLDAAREARDAREPPENGEARGIRLGVGSKVLSGTRTVLGAGASLASSMADKISDAIGTGIGKNPVTRSLSEAPEGSKRKGLYDNLMSGMLAFGRVYVAADHQGKLIIENTGRSAAEYAGIKYGEQAETATRDMAHIALDGYRIFRFPEKLGATSLVKGAFTSTVEENLEARKAVVGLGASGDGFEGTRSVGEKNGKSRPQVGSVSQPSTSQVVREFRESKA